MPDPIAVHLADNLKRLREARGWSQQQLADCSGVPRPTLAHLESGEGNPTLSVLVKVALALGSSLEQLVASPCPQITLVPLESLVVRQRGKSELRELFSDQQGIRLERQELPAQVRSSFGPVSVGHQQVIACESGRLEVTAAGSQFRLRSGSVLQARGELELVVENPGARVAVCFVAVLPLPPGT